MADWVRARQLEPLFHDALDWGLPILLMDCASLDDVEAVVDGGGGGTLPLGLGERDDATLGRGAWEMSWLWKGPRERGEETSVGKGEGGGG